MPFLANKGFPWGAKVRICSACVLRVMLIGNETRPIKDEDMTRLERNQGWFDGWTTLGLPAFTYQKFDTKCFHGNARYPSEGWLSVSNISSVRDFSKHFLLPLFGGKNAMFDWVSKLNLPSFSLQHLPFYCSCWSSIPNTFSTTKALQRIYFQCFSLALEVCFPAI